MVRARVPVLPLDDVGDGGVREHGAGGLGGVGEDRLGAGAELAVEQLDDLEDGDLGGLAGEGVAALDPALGAQDARPAQDGEELLEELDRDVAAAGQLADRDGAGVAERASSVRARRA